MLKSLNSLLTHSFKLSLIPFCLFNFNSLTNKSKFPLHHYYLWIYSSVKPENQNLRDKHLKHFPLPVFQLHRFFPSFLCSHYMQMLLYVLYVCVHNIELYFHVFARSLKMNLFVCVCVCEDSCRVSIKSSTTFPAVSFVVRLFIKHHFQMFYMEKGDVLWGSKLILSEWWLFANFILEVSPKLEIGCYLPETRHLFFLKIVITSWRLLCCCRLTVLKFSLPGDTLGTCHSLS